MKKETLKKRKEIVPGHTEEELRTMVRDRVGGKIADYMTPEELIEWYNLGV